MRLICFRSKAQSNCWMTPNRVYKWKRIGKVNPQNWPLLKVLRRCPDSDCWNRTRTSNMVITIRVRVCTWWMWIGHCCADNRLRTCEHQHFIVTNNPGIDYDRTKWNEINYPRKTGCGWVGVGWRSSSSWRAIMLAVVLFALSHALHVRAHVYQHDYYTQKPRQSSPRFARLCPLSHLVCFYDKNGWTWHKNNDIEQGIFINGMQINCQKSRACAQIVIHPRIHRVRYRPKW
jgi:hypothetical protein